MAELRYTYLLDVKDRASRQIRAANEQIARSATVANRALEKQGAVAQASARRVQTAGARQAAEWKQVARAAQVAERSVAQAATQASTSVSRAMERQVAAQRKAGASYAQIARQQKAAGASASATAAAIERSAARETAAAARTQKARQSAAQAFGTIKTFAGLGVGLGFAAATRDTIAFDKAMRNVNSLAQLSEARFGNLKKQVLALAGPTAQAPKTLADGLYDLVSSGFKARDALVVLRASAKAATAGLTTTEVSTKAVAAVLKAYGVGAKSAQNVSDILFQTVNRGVITFEDLADTVGDVLPFATSLGVKFTEVGAAVSTMTKEGIPAPLTMTRIKNAMVAFIKPSEGMAQALKKIGVESGEQLIKQRGFQGALEAVVRTTDGSKEAVVKLFPNIRALGGALALTGKHAKAAHGDLDAFRTGVKGATDRALSQQSKSLAFQWQQLKANAQAVGITIGQTLLPPLGKVFAFLRQHPTITKAAAALVAVGVAVRAIRFASALTGATGLLRTLTQIGAKRGVIAGVFGGSGAAGAAGGAAGAAAGIKALAVRLTGLVGVYALARAAADKFTAKMTASSNPVVSAYGKVQNVVQRLGRAFMGDRQGLTDYFTALFGGASKAQAKLKQTASAAAQVAAALGKLRGRDIAQSFAAEAASAGNVTVGMIRRVTASLGQLKGDARREARLSMQAMLKQLVAGGTITAAQAAKLEKAIAAKFGSLKDDLSGAARRGIRAITREFGALPGGISNPLRLSLAQTRSYMGRIISVVNVTVQQLRTMRALLAAGIEPVSPRSIGGGHRPAEGRTGGRMGPGGFRRYQQGGVVPAMVSPGEMIVHQGRAGMVPGAPVAADNVAMMLPVGAAVLTGDGQRMVSQGATVGEAIARQAPHYATGGWVRTGATVDPSDQAHQSPPGRKYWNRGISYAELGSAGANAAGGFMARLLGRKVGGLGLPFGFGVEVRVPHGRRSARVFKSDVGSGQKGDRFYTIDLHAQAARAIGFTAGKGPVEIRPLTGGTTTGGRPAYSTYAPRGRLITSGRAMQLGYQAGVEGGSLYPVYASVRDAVTYNRTVHPAVAGTRTGGGGSPRLSGAGAPNYGGSTGPIVTWEGKRMRSWMAHALAYARAHGWRGHVVEALRSVATQRRYYAEMLAGKRAGPVAKPGQSRHQTGNAVDVTPAGPYLQRFFRGYRGMRPKWFGPGDRPHYSDTGHRRGGIIGARRFQGGGLVGPGNAVAPRDPLPRYQPGMPMTTGPSVVGPATLQSTRGALGRLVGVEMTAYQKTVRMVAAAQRALLKAGAHDNQAIATALHAIDVGIQRVHQVSYGRLEKMAKQLKSAIATTKDPDTSRRLKAELRLVFGEMGRRIGLLAKEAADMVDPAVRAAVHVERILKASKGRISLTTDAQIGSLEKATQVGEDQLRAAIKKLQEAYRRAQKAGLKGAMHDLAGRIADLMGQLTQVMRDAKDAAQQAIADAIQAASDATAAARDRAARSFAAGQTIAGVDSASPEGLLAQYKFAGQQQQDLQSDLAKLQEMRKWAAGSGNMAAVAQIDEATREQQVKIQEGLANMADLARQGNAAVIQKETDVANAIKDAKDAAEQAAKDAADQAAQAAQDAKEQREAQRQATIDAATGAVSLAQGGLQTLTLQQQLAGTYDQGGQARADYITSTIIPAIQREIDTMRRNGASAQDVQQAQNDLLQSQLDAQEAIKGNTADTADALSKLGGTLGFEFQGARLTDDLIASGVGA